MKVAELIRRLIELDPTQDEEVLVGNHDILFVQRLPGHHDGDGQVLVRDDSRKDSYNVVGAKFIRHGTKLDIVTHGIEDALIDQPDMPVETETEQQARRVKAWRASVKSWDDEASMKLPDDVYAGIEYNLGPWVNEGKKRD